MKGLSLSRVARSHSLTEIAEVCGVSVSTAHRWTRPHGRCDSLDAVQRLLAVGWIDAVDLRLAGVAVPLTRKDQ